MAKKITPEIEKFIFLNRALSGGALRDLIAKKFKIVVTTRSVELHLAKARAAASADNAAKVEAVRAKILDGADEWANRYLRYVDDEIKSIRALIEESERGEKKIKLETAKDRMAASQALHRMLSTIIDFVKPEENTNVSINIEPDLSRLSIEELRQLRAIRQKLEGDRSGAGEEKLS
ncbi:MAG: hypothetical protein AB9879_09805 [Methanothrix sp.]